MSKFILARARRKLAGVGVIVIPSILVSITLGALLYLVAPFLPPEWREALALLRSAATSADPEKLRNLVGSTGVNVQVAFFGVQLLQVLLAPIPGHLTGFLGGYLFGFWRGLALSMAALIVGSTIVMLIGRLVGERIARRFVAPEIMARFDQNTMERSGVLGFFMIFLLPVFPDDAICFIAGLTRLSIPKLLVAATVGRIPGVAVLTYTGVSVNDSLFWGQIVFGTAIVVAIVVWFFEEELLAKIKQL